MNKTESEKIIITTNDVDACWATHHKEYLVDILNSEYILNVAREDILSLIGSKYDSRTPQ